MRRAESVRDLGPKAGAAEQRAFLAAHPDVSQLLVQIIASRLGMLANRRWLMRDYVRGFQYCPLRLTGEIDLYPMWIDAA